MHTIASTSMLADRGTVLGRPRAPVVSPVIHVQQPPVGREASSAPSDLDPVGPAGGLLDRVIDKCPGGILGDVDGVARGLAQQGAIDLFFQLLHMPCQGAGAVLLLLLCEHTVDLLIEALDVLHDGSDALFLLVDLVLQDLRREGEQGDHVLVYYRQMPIALATDHSREYLLQLLCHETVAAVLPFWPVLELEGDRPQLPQHPVDRRCLLRARSVLWGGRARAGLLGGFGGDRLVQRHDRVLEPAVGAHDQVVRMPRTMQSALVLCHRHAPRVLNVDLDRLWCSVHILDVGAYIAEVQPVPSQSRAESRETAHRQRAAQGRHVHD
mmetsp:Transcript_67078/g.151593  ORF Transcript_67078/g.151593 Transcript_67078/m.151593 type:complete len:325 (+) Transcript_67078:58-1032(+)